MQITKGNMKNITKLMIAALALGSSAWLATAQPADGAPPEGGPPGGPGMRPHRPPPLFLVALDANTNHVIDADEIANAAAALKALDTDGDGKLSLEELLGPPPGGGQGPAHRPGPPPGAGFGGGTNHPPVPPLIAELDANHDGVVDADELANAPTALLKLDKNGDGKLTPDEFLPPRRGPRGRGGPGPGGFGGPPPPQDAPQQQ
jgi:hypothetical protein